MEQGNIQFVRQLLPNVQELTGVIRAATVVATSDELWRITLGRFAVACGGWEVWWSSYSSFKSPEGADVFQLVVEANYRGGPTVGPLNRIRGMRLSHPYEATVSTPIATYDIRNTLAWLAGVVEKSFWEMRQKIAEAEDRCVMEEAKAIQGMTPDGVDTQAGRYLASQLSASQLGMRGMQAANNKLTISQAEGIGGALAGYQYAGSTGGFLSGVGGVAQTIPANWQEKILREQELARAKAEELARVAYEKMTDWRGEDPIERLRAEKQARAELDAIRLFYAEQLSKAPPPPPVRKAQTPAAPAEPEPEPDLTKPAKRKILAIDD